MTKIKIENSAGEPENVDGEYVAALFRAFVTLFERSGHGVVLLGRDVKIVYADGCAESILRTTELAVREQSLWVKRRSCNERLAAAIARAMDGSGSEVDLRSRGALLHVSVVPLGMCSARPYQPGEPAVMVIIRPPVTAHTGERRLSAYAAAHGITPSELRVLDLLLRDCAPKNIAAQLGVGIRTVRTHLSSLYVKTNTRNQRQLVVSVLRTVVRR